MNSQGWFLPLTFITVPILITVLLIVIRQQQVNPLPYHQSVQNSYNIVKPQKEKTFAITGAKNPLTILGTTLPQFALDLKNGQFSNIWIAHAQEQQGMVTAQAVNEKGDTNLKVSTHFDSNSKQLVMTPLVENSFKPGMYQLSVKVKTVTGKDITVTQNFAWGVLAINTNKAIYQPGDNVNIGMTVLDDVGATKCIAVNGTIIFGTAKVILTVTSPSGKVLNLSTDDGTISGSRSCKDRSYSDNPDFIAKLQNLSVVGKYKLHMEATTVFGTRSIDSFFTVQATPPAFDIERATYPTRIYPRYKYPVTVDVTPQQNYSGTVYDIVPASFEITGVSGNATIVKSGDYQKIQWQVNWQAGQLQTLSYTIKFPNISPEYYLVGPLTIGNFTEGNEWQIASDSIFNFIQEANNFVTSGTSVTATLGTGASANDLLVMNCYKVTSSGSNTSWPNISGWSRSYRSGPSGERVAQYYRVVSGAEIGATNITCTTGASSTGEFAVEVMEYSGNATTSPRDKSATFRTSGVNCTTTSDIMGTLTPTNPDELIVTQFVSTVPSRTVISHTTLAGVGAQGFTDNDWNGGFDGFSGSDSSYDSAWGEDVGGSGRDTVKWTGVSSNTCYNGGTAYNPTISIAQGSFRFFSNLDNLMPGSAFGSVNQNFSPTLIGQPFRLRMLLDIDSTGGNLLSLQSLDMILQFGPLPTSGLCSSIPDDGWTPVATVGAQTQTAIAWNQNPSIPQSGVNISTDIGNDPTDSGYSNILESYYQDDFSSNGPDSGGGEFDSPGDITNDQNQLANNQAGLWDFSLVDNTGGAGVGTYCLELSNADGSPLSSYKHFPEITFTKAGVVIRGGSVIKGTGGAGCADTGGTCGTLIK